MGNFLGMFTSSAELIEREKLSHDSYNFVFQLPRNDMGLGIYPGQCINVRFGLFMSFFSSIFLVILWERLSIQKERRFPENTPQSKLITR